MAGKGFLLVVLGTLTNLAATAAAQQNYELTGIIGRTFISDQGVQGVVSSDTILHSGKGFTFEVNVGRRLMEARFVSLTLEVPLAFNPDEDVHKVNLAPRQYSSFFVTPSIRANVFPSFGFSPWVSVGGGFGHFKESSNLEFGGPNPGKTGTSSGVFQIGGGVDVKTFRWADVRLQVRDFYSGVPQLNLDTGKSRQHNLFVGGGLVLHF